MATRPTTTLDEVMEIAPLALALAEEAEPEVEGIAEEAAELAEG